MQLIINAGGTGTRLWPYSTNSRPKQFSAIIDQQTFLEKTYDRLRSSFSHDKIWVNTNVNFSDLVLSNLPTEFITDHVLTEPQKRDNFASIISHAAVVASKVGRNETMIFLHADHLIKPEHWQIFNDSLKKIDTALQQNQYEIITAGVKPTSPNTQLGYIETVVKDISPASTSNPPSIKKVKQFREKPDLATAKKFLQEENFLWNLGYFSFTYEGLLNSVEKLFPEILPVLESIYDLGYISPELYNQIPKTTFDYAIAEKADSLGVVEMPIEWEDIGNWEVVKRYLPPLAQNPNYTELLSNNNQIKSSYKNKPVAFIGVDDLIVVDTPDGLLILNPKYAGEVKQVAKYFEENPINKE